MHDEYRMTNEGIQEKKVLSISITRNWEKWRG